MPVLLDTAYLVFLGVTIPWLLYRTLKTGRYRRGLFTKLTGRIAISRSPTAPRETAQRVWFHGVSVGEVHLLRQVVGRFRQVRPDCDCVISSTTDTGLDEARRCFPDLPVIAWPLDFSWAVSRALDTARPDLIVLAESELWPGMLVAARKRSIPVVVVNGRLSPRSMRRFRFFAPLARRLFRLVDRFAVQTAEYAENLTQFGVAPERITVTGSVKYDGVMTEGKNPKTTALRNLFAIHADNTVWVAGSTQAPEEEIALGIFQRLKPTHPNLRLIIVPRQRDRFHEVACLLRQAGVNFVRRSQIDGPVTAIDAIILLDTIGELSAAWGLADIAFVGGSLDGKRGGQNMIEPAAYGCAVTFGPHVWNFRHAVERLLAANAAVQVADKNELESAIGRLMADADERRRLGDNARVLVLSQQGATDRTVALLDHVLGRAVRRAA